MTLNELLQQYPNREAAAQIWATQEDILLEDARFVIALALGDTEGDVMVQRRDGSVVALFPLDKDDDNNPIAN